ncbi:NifB/NifX family molybdenum-iron cluster-binding protein [Pseudoxanthomonas mexicana]|uniref:NifB/NifX family molybdenum-iron cluster-binding protein n=1 Tax=Pseudoxanthomonas mexicana TaxID=128785 RepID=UPI001389C70A|nr:NifB/NifX family molybdenum-iron cluster-binding protein [Pseudoxanthomonas mexicana]
MTTIALTTQNRRHVTPHAGRCRHFMVKRVGDGCEGEWESRALAKEQTLFSCAEGLPDAPRDVDVIITASAGPGLQARLARHGVHLGVTDILLPEQALAAWREGHLEVRPPLPAAASRADGGTCRCAGHNERIAQSDPAPSRRTDDDPKG